MTDLLPPRGMIRQWVELYRDFSEAPDEAHLATALATVSAGIGWKAPISFVEGSEEPCNISVILEGQSAAAKKTTTANIARRLVNLATSDMDDELKTLFVHAVSHTSGRGLLEMVCPKSEEKAKEWDTSPPPGHLIMWDEFGGMLGDPGSNRKGSDWHGQIRSTLLQMTNGWHGGSKTGSFKAPASRVAISIIGTMTRVELEQRVDTALFQDGFMGRFMIIPHNGSARYIAIPKSPGADIVAGRRQLEQWVRSLATRRMDFGNPFDLMTQAAKDRREQWYFAHKFQLEDAMADDPTDVIASCAYAAFNRLQATQVKLAMIQAVSELSADRVQVGVPEITEEHMAWAEGVVALSLDEVRSLLDAGHKSLADEYRDRVVSYLRKEADEQGRVTRKQLMHNCTLGYLDARERWSIVADMENEGTVTITYERAAVGKPTTWVALKADSEGIAQT